MFLVCNANFKKLDPKFMEKISVDKINGLSIFEHHGKTTILRGNGHINMNSVCIMHKNYFYEWWELSTFKRAFLTQKKRIFRHNKFLLAPKNPSFLCKIVVIFSIMLQKWFPCIVEMITMHYGSSPYEGDTSHNA